MSFWDTLGNVAKTAGNIMNPIGAIADVGLGFMNYSQQKKKFSISERYATTSMGQRGQCYTEKS